MRRRIVPSLRTPSQTAMTIGTLGLVGLVGFLDCLAGYELSFSLFYFAPIILGTWLVGSRLGVAVASLSTLVWLGEDLASGHAFVHPLIPFWNALMRVSCFLIVVLLLAWLKRSDTVGEPRRTEVWMSCMPSLKAKKLEMLTQEKVVLER